MQMFDLLIINNDYKGSGCGGNTSSLVLCHLLEEISAPPSFQLFFD